MFPGCAVETHQHLPGWKVHQQQGEKDLQGELLIVDGAFHAPLLGFKRADARHFRGEIAVIDALYGDHRQHEVNYPLKGVNPEGGHAGFKMLGEFGTLGAGGF